MGKMNKNKLLHKTTRDFLALAAVTLFVCAPIFYFVSQWLYIYETEEVLQQHKNAFVNQSSKNFTTDDIKTWNRFNLHFTILPDMGITRDSIVGTTMEDSIAEEKEPFRIIYAPVEIAGRKYTYTEKIHLLEMERLVYSIAGMFTFIIVILFIGIVWLSKKPLPNAGSRSIIRWIRFMNLRSIKANPLISSKPTSMNLNASIKALKHS